MLMVGKDVVRIQVPPTGGTAESLPLGENQGFV